MRTQTNNSLEGRPAWQCHRCDGWVTVDVAVDLPHQIREAHCAMCGDRWWLPVFARGAPTRWQARLDLVFWDQHGWPQWAVERIAWYWQHFMPRRPPPPLPSGDVAQ